MNPGRLRSTRYHQPGKILTRGTRLMRWHVVAPVHLRSINQRLSGSRLLSLLNPELTDLFPIVESSFNIPSLLLFLRSFAVGDLFQLLLSLHHRHACCRHLQPSVALVSFLTRSIRPHSYIRCVNNSGSSKLNISLFLIRSTYHSQHSLLNQVRQFGLVIRHTPPSGHYFVYPRPFFCPYQEDYPFIDGVLLQPPKRQSPR